MAPRQDRVGELLEGLRRNRRLIISPEGIELDVSIASKGERLTAFVLDFALLIATIIALFLLFGLFLAAYGSSAVGLTLILFIAFIVRNLYFLHFELAWQGRSPGKKICGLRVINREGGELTPSAIIARNLTREVETFLPFGIYMNLDASQGAWQQLTLLGWVVALSALPFFNRDHQRAGDMIAGTIVITMPKRALLADLAETTVVQRETAQGRYVFTPEQLAAYGAFELQVLEELLRRPQTDEADRLLAEVCQKICNKIGWPDAIPAAEVRRFLTDFYAAERADLERGQLFGRLRADKTAALKKH